MAALAEGVRRMTTVATGLRVSRSAAASAPIWALALVALLVLGGCGAGPLFPMDESTRAVGDTEVWHSRAGTTTHTLVAMDAASMRYEVAENDCAYTLPRDGLLPWTAWTNCRSLPDGTQTVTLTAGQMWPLEIGRTWRYRRAGSDSSGDRWDEEVRCKVTKQDRVQNSAGFFRVFYTVCLSDSERRVLYVSPDLGRSVRTWYSRLEGSAVPVKQELVQFTPGK